MRMRLVVGFILLFFIFLLSRVYYLSIKSNVYYEELAKQNAIKTEFYHLLGVKLQIEMELYWLLMIWVLVFLLNLI